MTEPKSDEQSDVTRLTRAVFELRALLADVEAERDAALARTPSTASSPMGAPMTDPAARSLRFGPAGLMKYAEVPHAGPWRTRLDFYWHDGLIAQLRWFHHRRPRPRQEHR
jgi:hypothetical protein